MIGSPAIEQLFSKLDKNKNKDKDIPFRQKVSFEQRKEEAKGSRTRYYQINKRQIHAGLR